MKKRHENELNQLLEKVAYEGLAMVPKWQMSLWYDQDRFTVGIRRDVRERWIELASTRHSTSTTSRQKKSPRARRQFLYFAE